MIDIITVRGAGEPQNGPNNLLTQVTRHLDKTRFRIIGDVRYPASVGPANEQRNPAGPNLKQSVNAGKLSLANMIRNTDNLVGVLGFSLGAYVVSDFLEDMADSFGYTKGLEVAFTATIANPRRERGMSWPGWGIAGEHEEWPKILHYEVARPEDGIPCCPPNSPLRRLADHVVMAAKPQRSQLSWWPNPFEAVRAYQLAGQLISGYLTGQHDRAYIDTGLCRELADTINLDQVLR